MCRVKRLILVLFMWAPLIGFAQLAAKTEEFWPESKIYYKFNDKFRLYLHLSETREQTSYSEGAIGLFVDYFTYPFGIFSRPQHNEELPKRYLWFRAGYQYSMSPPEAENPFKESMLVTEMNGRDDLPWEILMTVKNRFDWRFKDDGFSVRYRPRLDFEKDLRTEFLFFTPFIRLEYFANFGKSSINKFRTEVGIEFKVSRTVVFENYWNHQFANSPDVSKVDAYGITLKLYFIKGGRKKERENMKK